MTTGTQLQSLGRLIFGRNNLIGSDFAHAKAWEIKHEFPQDPGGGVLIQFAVSYHALGKLAMSEQDADAKQAALSELLGYPYGDVEGDS